MSNYGNCHGDKPQDALAHCNFDLEFIYVHNSGWKSSTHDSKLLSDAWEGRIELK